MIRKEAWPFYKTGVRLCWELEEPKGPKGGLLISEVPLQSARTVSGHFPFVLKGNALDTGQCDLWHWLQG